MDDGWKSKASWTVGAEFDERPLGSLNVELHTIPFSCQTQGHSHGRGKDERPYTSVCQHGNTLQMLKLGPGEAPGEVQKLLWVDNV